MSDSMLDYRLNSVGREIDSIRHTPHPTDNELRELARLEATRYNLLLERQRLAA